MNNLLNGTSTIFNYNLNKNSFASFKHEDLERLGLYLIGGIEVSVGDLVACLIRNAIRRCLACSSTLGRSPLARNQ